MHMCVCVFLSVCESYLLKENASKLCATLKDEEKIAQNFSPLFFFYKYKMGKNETTTQTTALDRKKMKLAES